MDESSKQHPSPRMPGLKQFDLAFGLIEKFLGGCADDANTAAHLRKHIRHADCRAHRRRANQIVSTAMPTLGRASYSARNAIVGFSLPRRARKAVGSPPNGFELKTMRCECFAQPYASPLFGVTQFGILLDACGQFAQHSLVRVNGLPCLMFQRFLRHDSSLKSNLNFSARLLFAFPIRPPHRTSHKYFRGDFGLNVMHGG